MDPTSSGYLRGIFDDGIELVGKQKRKVDAVQIVLAHDYALRLIGQGFGYADASYKGFLGFYEWEYMVKLPWGGCECLF